MVIRICLNLPRVAGQKLRHFVSVECANFKSAQIAEGDSHRSMSHDSLNSTQVPSLFIYADGTSMAKAVEGLFR